MRVSCLFSVHTQLLQTECNDYEYEYNSAVNNGESLSSFTSVIGREQIRYELQELKTRWLQTVADITELDTRTAALRALVMRCTTDADALQQSISEHVSLLNETLRSTECLSVDEKRSQLHSIKVYEDYS